MGKGSRGGQEKAIKAYEGPLWDANTLFARNAGNIMYGGDTSSPANYNQPSPVGGTAVPRQRAPGVTAGPVPTRGGDGGKQVNYDRAYEVYRHLTREPESHRDDKGRHHDWLMGPAEEELVDWIFETHGDNYRPAFDYRDAQKRGAGAEELAKFAPPGWSGSPLTEQDLFMRDNPGGVQGAGGGQGVSGPGAGGVAGMSIDNYLDLMNRYGEFAETGGYDPQTLDAIRSRALSPSRAVYSDVNRSIDRSRSLQGDYAPNYAAVKAKTARGQSMALSDATTNVEGGIGQMVQQGRLAGLGGMSSLYGTTPGLANMFGNQALQAQQLQNQAGFGLIDARQRAKGLPGAYETTMSRIGDVGGMALPFMPGGQFRSDRDSKKNIKPIKKGILYKLKKLPISTWSYKDDPDGTIHIGPMAQDFYELFGGDDDKTIHPVDVAGVTLGAVKELAEAYGT